VALFVRQQTPGGLDEGQAALAPPPSIELRRIVTLPIDRSEMRIRELTDIGIPRSYLARMCEEGVLIKVGYGRSSAADRQAA
jgi:hypothetical protein